MLRNGTSPVFDFEFLRALDHEFNPQCDPERGSHTLAKLAMSVIDKGEKISQDKISRQPSWGKEFSVEVVGTKAGKDKPRSVLWLGLHGPHRDISFTFDNKQHQIIVTSSGVKSLEPEFEVPISLSRQEDWSQSAAIIAMATEAFFDTPPHAADLTTVDKSI
ncbi:hypothetical protein A3F37_02750 [Candidatus Saccharibacteria bacterium RIFCSPHIGHO2_12_FULL_41_12]|nr:MAG: hypothetical protein A3F37_02750 [Candidatus Saccharibacteria bacterium RIFCSPHIGHO2_12_FULL_41_12]